MRRYNCSPLAPFAPQDAPLPRRNPDQRLPRHANLSLHNHRLHLRKYLIHLTFRLTVLLMACSAQRSATASTAAKLSQNGVVAGSNQPKGMITRRNIHCTVIIAEENRPDRPLW